MMRASARTLAAVGLVVPVLVMASMALAPTRWARAEETAVGPSWPQWRGPRRDGASDETGLLQSWPEKGPALLWTSPDIGRGFSSPIVVGDSIYITGDVGENLVIFALGLDGSLRWRATNGASWKGSHPGARAACTHDGGRLYHMNAHGRVACLEARTGKELWSADTFERFGARNVTWGTSESVLIDRKRVIVTAAGEKALVAALDAETGQTLWASPPLEGEITSYSSPILVETAARRIIVNGGSKNAFAVDAETGSLLWTHRHPIPENVLGATPIVLKDSLFIPSSSRDHSCIYRLRLDGSGKEPTQVWSLPIKNGQGGLVHAAGRLYGANGIAGAEGIVSVDPETGNVSKVAGDLGFGCAAYADGRIYYLSQRGEVALLKPTEAGAEIVGRFRLVEPREKDAWAHPVIHGGRLFLRYHESLRAYDIRRR